MPIDPKLMEILCCPKTHAPLVEDGDWLVSTDAETRLRYPVVDDIPHMLIEEAEEMSQEDWKAVMARHGKE